MKFIVSILSLVPVIASFSAQEDAKLPQSDAWMTFFNREDLSGWDGALKVWRVKDGYISGGIVSIKTGDSFSIAPSDWVRVFCSNSVVMTLISVEGPSENIR